MTTRERLAALLAFLDAHPEIEPESVYPNRGSDPPSLTYLGRPPAGSTVDASRSVSITGYVHATWREAGVKVTATFRDEALFEFLPPVLRAPAMTLTVTL